MNVILWADYISIGAVRDSSKIKDIPVIAVVEDYDELGTMIEIDGVVYGMASVSKRDGFISVHVMSKELGQSDESYGDDEIVCPHCKTELSDSWEYDDDGTLDCDYCGSEFDFTRDMTVAYSTKLKKVGADPIHMENIKGKE